MNTTAESTPIAVRHSRSAEELGAGGIMLGAPRYATPHPAEVVLHFKTVAEAVHIPVFIQDEPSAPIGPGLAVNIARQHENLCYVKVETPPTVPRMAELANLRAGSGLVIFGGYGGAFLFEEVRRGSVGTMPDCTIPDVFVRVWRGWHAGRRQEAEGEFRRYAAYSRAAGQELGLSAWTAKHVLVRRGIFKTAHARRPALPPDERLLREIDEILDELGLAPA
jgi:4-hydroxy-tetrahydrodipicolinate synthase